MPASVDHNTVSFMLSQRLRRIVRVPHSKPQHAGWVVWLDTADYKYGTYMWLCDDGSVQRCTDREDGNDECIEVRPSDAEVYRKEL